MYRRTQHSLQQGYLYKAESQKDESSAEPPSLPAAPGLLHGGRLNEGGHSRLGLLRERVQLARLSFTK